MKHVLIIVAVFFLASFAANADETAFHPGPLIGEFGNIASIDSDLPIPEESVFKVSFDVAKQADAGKINRNLESAARFLNMHVEAGMDTEQLSVAIVVHGGASKDLLKKDVYEKRLGTTSANAALLESLMQHGVQVMLCGQTAAYYDIDKKDLIPGVQMSLSAMTAHALLQQQGYTLNPF